MTSTINSGNFKFSELQNRIVRLYAMGSISETELNDLLALAFEKANPETERPETLVLIQNLSSKVDTLTSRVESLAAQVQAFECGDATDDGTSEYAAWEAWDGLSNKYQPGSVVDHKGQLWESVYNGQNVWEPGVVDQRFWIMYSPEV